jgi:hypothetical protein
MPTSRVNTSPSNIIDRVAEFTARYVFLPHKRLYRLLALWVVATYLHQEFDYMGYLFAYSAAPQSGKSRLLEVLDLVVCNSSGVIVSPTEAVLFRTASGQTQLIDEADSYKNLDSLRSVLNAGFHRGGKVKRMQENMHGTYTPVEFPVYGPRVLAGIGLQILNETTRDRTFTIQMVRQKRSERGQRFRRNQVKPEADELRSQIERWVIENKARISDRYAAEFDYLAEFRDRTIDVTEPLAAILEIAFADEDRDQLQQAKLDLLDAVTLTRKEQESPAFDCRVLAALDKLAEHEDPLVASASELAEKLHGTVEGVHEYNVAGVLRSHGFETKSVRKEGAEPRYRYTLGHQALRDLTERYLGPEAPENSLNDVAAPKATVDEGTAEGVTR